jgi:hypothetical protein
MDFLDELGLFIGEQPVITKKKIRSSAVCHDFMAVQMKNFVHPLFEISFQEFFFREMNYFFVSVSFL